jgi:hypothetical protein
MGDHRLGLYLVGQGRRHVADLEAAGFLMPGQQTLIGGAAGVGLDRHLRDDVGRNLVLLGQPQKPVDRHGVAGGDAGDRLGSRQSNVYVR